MSDRAAGPASASAAEPPARRKIVRKQQTRTGLKTLKEVVDMHRKSAAARNAAAWWKLVSITTIIVEDKDDHGENICYERCVVQCKSCSGSHGAKQGPINVSNWAGTHFADHKKDHPYCKATKKNGMPCLLVYDLLL